MKVYRAWYKNGTSRLVEAKSKKDAKEKAEATAKTLGYESEIVKIEDSGVVAKVRRGEPTQDNQLKAQSFIYRHSLHS
jgi:hypothetical protein